MSTVSHLHRKSGRRTTLDSGLNGPRSSIGLSPAKWRMSRASSRRAGGHCADWHEAPGSSRKTNLCWADSDSHLRIRPDSHRANLLRLMSGFRRSRTVVARRASLRCARSRRAAHWPVHGVPRNHAGAEKLRILYFFRRRGAAAVFLGAPVVASSPSRRSLPGTRTNVGQTRGMTKASKTRPQPDSGWLLSACKKLGFAKPMGTASPAYTAFRLSRYLPDVCPQRQLRRR